MSPNVNETQAPAIQFIESLSDTDLLIAMAACIVLIAIIAIWPSKSKVIAPPPNAFAAAINDAHKGQRNET